MSVLKRLFKKALFIRNNKRLLNLNCVGIGRVDNVAPKKIENICFVIPGITAFSGGITSILRLGSYLSSFGYTVTYACCDNQAVKSLKSSAYRCLPNYKGNLIRLCDYQDDADIVIATNAISVYHAIKLNGYKIYFIQDYEPFFYQAGDYHLIAKKTYELGFHMVSLGDWNKKMIKKYVNNFLDIDTICFPYEHREYQTVKRNYLEYQQKTEFNLCVYIRETPRRLPGFCQFIAKYLTERFLTDGMRLNVYFYGEDIGKFKYGKNLGKLNKKQLFELYTKCDFGMVASYTNISLVPFEMMATGLPIIEFQDGSFETFFDKADAFLFDFDFEKLYHCINEAIKNPQILTERNERIQKRLSNLSWENSARQFESILKNLVQEG